MEEGAKAGAKALSSWLRRCRASVGKSEGGIWEVVGNACWLGASVWS